MSKYIDITLKDKSWIFPGSVCTHRCSPTEICHDCGGSGRCTACAGKGEIRCDKCGGRGVLRCGSCKGSGVCSHCNGRGYSSNPSTTCGFCSGSGRCSSCHGSGTEDCYKCNGRGFNICDKCNGRGNCPMCGGSGELICSRCKGTGFYQTYIEYTAHYCVRQYCNPGPTPDFMEGLRVATGEELCHIVAKYWKKDNIVQFDNTEKAFEDLISKSGMYAKYAEKFKNDYTQISDNEQSINGYQQ